MYPEEKELEFGKQLQCRFHPIYHILFGSLLFLVTIYPFIAIHVSDYGEIVNPMTLGAVPVSNLPTGVASGRHGTMKRNKAPSSAMGEKKKMQRESIKAENTTKTVREDPWFILHIGPQKTATTTIQCGLAQFSDMLAKEDNYYYLGQACESSRQRKIMRNGERSFKSRLILNHLGNPYSSENYTLENHEHFEEFRQRLEWHKDKGHNLIMSSELFGSHMETTLPHIWNGLREILSEFRVRIIVSYRHFFDWLPSNYYQKNIGNEVHFPSLLDWIEEHLNSWEKMREDYERQRNHNIAFQLESHGRRSESHISLWLFQTWSRYFDDIRIFDMHQDGYLGAKDTIGPHGDLVAAFICQMLPSSENSCKILHKMQQSNAEVGDNKLYKRRQSVDLFPQRILETAIERKMVNHKHLQRNSRQRATRKVRNILTSQGILPFQASRPNKYFDCISPPIEERMLKESLYFMERIYNSTASQKNGEGSMSMKLSDSEWADARAKHNHLFSKKKSEGKFCDINPDRILEDHGARFF